jgi:hypothetical protein
MQIVCWKNTSTKHNKYVAIQKLEHFDQLTRTCWYSESLCADIVAGITIWNQNDIKTCS